MAERRALHHRPWDNEDDDFREAARRLARLMAQSYGQPFRMFP